MGCKNCMGSCIHKKMKELREKHKEDIGGITIITSEHKGYEHYCDKDSEAYRAWHERNGQKTYEECKTDELPCYEPTEFARRTDEMIVLMEDILAKMDKKENK